jgi:hypothetical protein
MIYITFERGGPKFSNNTTIALTWRTAVQQYQLRAKWLELLLAQIGVSNDKGSSSSEVEC